MSDTTEQAEVPEELTSGDAGGPEQELAGAAGAATPARDEPMTDASSGAGGGDDLASGIADAVEGDGGSMPG